MGSGVEGKGTHVDFTTGWPGSIHAIHWEHPNCWPQPITGGRRQGWYAEYRKQGTYPFGSFALTSTLP